MAGLPRAPDWQAWAQQQLAKLGSLSAFPLSLNEVGPGCQVNIIQHVAFCEAGCCHHNILRAVDCLTMLLLSLFSNACLRLPALLFPVQILQAAQLDDRGLRSYLQYLQRGLFASFSPPAELESVHRLFLRLAALPASGPDPQPAGRGSDHAAPQAQYTGAAAAAGASADAEQPLHQQPSSRPPSGYLHYGTAPRGKALFHPDYALLLTACAPLVWLTPEALHEVRAETRCRRCMPPSSLLDFGCWPRCTSCACRGWWPHGMLSLATDIALAVDINYDAAAGGSGVRHDWRGVRGVFPVQQCGAGAAGEGARGRCLAEAVRPGLRGGLCVGCRGLHLGPANRHFPSEQALSFI